MLIRGLIRFYPVPEAEQTVSKVYMLSQSQTLLEKKKRVGEQLRTIETVLLAMPRQVDFVGPVISVRGKENSRVCFGC